MSAEAGATVRAPYFQFAATACSHTLALLPHRKMTYLAAIVAFSPVVIPLALTLPDELWYEVEGEQAFLQLAHFFYLTSLCPLLALFFGCMLIGEDIESETFPYVLTRAIPRSAWVFGKFLGYLIGVGAMLGTSLALVYLGCTRLAGFPLSGATLKILANYEGVLMLGLAAYGALSLLLGAAMNRPMIWGIVLLFFWQPLARALPGRIELLTVDKYVSVLLPLSEDLSPFRELLSEVASVVKVETVVHPWAAFGLLLAITVGFVGQAAVVVRRREYYSTRN